MSIIFLLIFGHFLADYPLQSAAMAKYKSPKYTHKIPWYHWMIAHCWIHAGAVYLIVLYHTPEWALFFTVIEFFVHLHIDLAKINEKIGADLDQILHIFFKVFYAGLLINFGYVPL